MEWHCSKELVGKYIPVKSTDPVAHDAAKLLNLQKLACYGRSPCLYSKSLETAALPLKTVSFG